MGALLPFSAPPLYSGHRSGGSGGCPCALTYGPGNLRGCAEAVRIALPARISARISHF
jgi:hypothetical protein